ncbi:MAG: ATP-binding protein [Actinomycetota bacterium]|nr:ATP-binding protein [Actinomycetota bacterium]
MRAESPTVRVDLDSKPETLTIVRGMLGGVAELLFIEPELLDDLKTAVSEACNNIVLHAYGGEPGPMSVSLFIDERLRVTVEDRGVGLPAREPPDGIGLSVIRALAADVTLRSEPGQGTQVQMEFEIEHNGRPLLRPPESAAPDPGWERGADDQVVVSLSPVSLLPGVLGRLARTLAATAHFSLDRFSDVYLVTDTLAAHAMRAAAALRVQARLATRDRRLELCVGPFHPGSSEQLRSTPGERTPSPLALLTDELSILPDGDGELLRVVVIDHRR